MRVFVRLQVASEHRGVGSLDVVSNNRGPVASGSLVGRSVFK